MAVNYGSLPFLEQIEFFRRKLNIPTESWTDIYNAEHDWAFMVAGANRDALLADFRSAVDKVIAEGATLADFRRDFDNIVATHGWDFNGGRDWRSRTIYETNLFSSYNAGRFEQLQAARATLPYWQYHHSGSENPRPEHLAWDGLVLAADDPFWEAHFPPNGWGCQCSASGMDGDDLADMGKTGPDPSPEIELETRVIGQRSAGGPRQVRVPKGIDPGFEHTPGRSRLEGAIPPQRPGGLSGASSGPGLPNALASDPLPEPRALPSSMLLADDLPDAEYASAFLDGFGATLEQPVLFRDVMGEALAIGRGLFEDRATGSLQANQQGRGPMLPILAEALRDPDEIWVRMDQPAGSDKTVVRRRYIAQYRIDGSDELALAVFERADDGWSGLTTLAPGAQDIADVRGGVRLYQRGQ